MIYFKCLSLLNIVVVAVTVGCGDDKGIGGSIRLV